MLGRALLSCSGLLTLAWLQDGRAPDPLAAERDLASLVPANALVYAEAPALPGVLAQGLEHPLAKALLAGELGALIQQGTGKSASELVKLLDEQAGLAVLPTVAELAERGLALAVAYEKEAPTWLLLARGADAAKQRELVASLLEAGAVKAGFPGAFDEPGDEIAGADVWYVGGQLKLALRECLVIASNDGDLLRGALSLAANADQRGLAGTEPFTAAASERSGAHLVWAWAHLDGLEAYPKIADTQALRAMLRDPAAQFLLGPGISALGSGAALTLSVDLEREDLHLSLRASGLDLGAAQALLPSSERVVLDLAAHPNDVAHALVYRDGAAVFAQRVELFPAETLPGFAKASSDLALFFGGRDLAETILPRVSPWLRLVARPVAFDANARPEMPLPAAAFIVEVDDATELGPVLVSAFQTAVGLINVDRAQKGLDSMLMKLELVDDVQLTSARFAPPREGDGIDLRYNLAPACAMVGRAFIVGTHAALVADLARELRKSPGTVAVNHERLQLTGEALAEIVRTNFDALAAQAVLNDGKTREKAEGELRGLIGLLEVVATAGVHVAYPSAGAVQLDLTLDLVAAKD